MPEIREDRPSYVRFERHPVEDREATMAQGHYMTRDVDMAIITPVGSKDEIPMLAPSWLKNLEQQVREERIPRAHFDQYKAAYESWKRNEEIPINGTPIKGWQPLSPSQQANILAANIRTVEDLAQANGEALSRIGMGAREYQQKAEVWLRVAAGPGKVAAELSALAAQVKTLTSQVDSLQEQNIALRNENKSLASATAATAPV